MFYSHQLLARKAPLGQIWMAATMHAKIHRRKLNKLNIIKICEEILNPSVPMALRLSGILMGGVVIVYERKVKLLYDDVTRLLVEINEAWKVKSAPSDPTRLPKGKSQAKYASITLPPNRNEDLGDIEESIPYSHTATKTDFQQTSYFAMRLDSVDDPFLNHNLQGDQEQDHHQADAANITLNDNFDSYQADTTTFNHFERFDVEGDEEMQWNFTQPAHTDIPSIIPSPTRQEELPKSDEVLERHHQEQGKQQFAESKEPNLDQKRQKIARKRATRPTALAMDYDRTIISGPEYQSWLQDPSDLMRERITKRPSNPFSMMKKSTLMELQSVVLMEKLFTNGRIHYPAPLMEMWIECIQPPHDSPSAGTSRPQPPEPSSSSSPPERMPFTGPARDPFEGFHSGVGSPSTRISIEKQRANAPNNEIPNEILIDELRNNLKNNTFGFAEANGVSASNANLMATPANSGDGIRSIPSSGSGHGFFSHNSETNSGRSSKKRPFSASKNSGNGLEPVAEDLAWEHADPNFKLSKLPKNKSTPDYDLLVETGPTQTQKHHPVNNPPLDQITDSIRMHLKTHFDTPGCAQVESLNQLALGMNKKRAASLFYQTCVLATRDHIRVEQKVPYGDILISRGPKM